MKTIVIVLAGSVLAAGQILAASADEWTTAAPREEIRPEFQRAETGGKSGHGALTIRADEREGLHGWWQKTLPVTAGRHYRFSAWRRTENVAVPRRSVLARVLWRDDDGKQVPRREGVVTNYAHGVVASAEPEYPGESGTASNGWVELSGVYEAPPGATQARVELHLLWAPNGNVHGATLISSRPNRRLLATSVSLPCITVRATQKRRWTPAGNSRRSSKRPRAAKPTWSCWAKP